MRMRFAGPSVSFRDAEPKFEEVRDADDDQTEEFEPVADCKAAEAFARASDRRHGYRSALTADELAGLTPEQKFARASDARNNIGCRPGRRR